MTKSKKTFCLAIHCCGCLASSGHHDANPNLGTKSAQKKTGSGGGTCSNTKTIFTAPMIEHFEQGSAGTRFLESKRCSMVGTCSCFCGFRRVVVTALPSCAFALPPVRVEVKDLYYGPCGTQAKNGKTSVHQTRISFWNLSATVTRFNVVVASCQFMPCNQVWKIYVCKWI